MDTTQVVGQGSVEEWAADESRADAAQRERQERREASQRKALNTPESARIVYLEIAANDRRLTHTQFRFLSLRAQDANPDLSNCFASLRKVAKRMGVSPRRARNLEQELKRAGYLRTQEFQSDDGDEQAASGVQFTLPARVVPANGGRPWRGSTQWDQRQYGRPKASRRTAHYATDDP